MIVHHLALGVHDLDAMVDFYKRVVGLRLIEWHHDDQGQPRSAWLALGEEGSFLALERCADRPRPEGEWRIDAPGYFLVALRIEKGERARWEARLREYGVAIHHRTQWTLYFRDPEGNRVALSHHPDAESGFG
jgi:glyoxylase I family protein